MRCVPGPGQANVFAAGFLSGSIVVVVVACATQESEGKRHLFMDNFS